MGKATKHHRPGTGQQGDAPLRYRVQPEEVPEIRSKTFEKRGGADCFDGIGKKYPRTFVRLLHKASKIGFANLTRQEKSPLKELVVNLYFENHRLVQRLPLL